MEKEGKVSFSMRAEGVGEITFYHPSGNALPGYLLSDLADAVEKAGSDPAIRVMVLQSGGDRAFCGGANFDELLAIRDADNGKKFFMGFAKVINAMRTCPKLIIGRVQGKAVGGGVGLASATDYCLATQYASVKLSEFAIGIGAFVVGPAVARKIGNTGLAELAIDAENWRSAEWARNRGLFANVYQTNAAMDAALGELASRLAGYNPVAMKAFKRTLWEGCDHWAELLPERAGLSGQLVLSEFTTRAIEAFRSK